MIGWTTDEARDQARRLYAVDEPDRTIQIDADAPVTHLDEPGPVEGAAWVQAWVYVPPKDR